jgi:hypothetical protein
MRVHVKPFDMWGLANVSVDVSSEFISDSLISAAVSLQTAHILPDPAMVVGEQ